MELGAICADVPDTYENLYAFFIGRVRDRLHVILCFSPVGATFARRAQQVCDVGFHLQALCTVMMQQRTLQASSCQSCCPFVMSPFGHADRLLAKSVGFQATWGCYCDIPADVTYLLSCAVPWPGQWRNHRLVPPVAGGGAHGCCWQIH